MSKAELAVFIVNNNIDNRITERFIASIRGGEREIPLDILIGSHANPNEVFRKTTIFNDILRQGIKEYKVMIQTDVDMFVPPGLIRHTRDVVTNKDVCYHSEFRYTEPEEIDKLLASGYKNIPWKAILTRPCKAATGAWNGMNIKTWIRSNGFNEEIYNLGGPDTEFNLRSLKLNIKWIREKTFALSHVNHPRRSIPKQGQLNMTNAKKYSTDYNWLKNRYPNVSPTIIQKIKVNYQ